MQKVGIFFNQHNEKASLVAQSIKEWLGKKSKTVYSIIDKSSKDEIESLELVVSVGGDGSLLKVASICKGMDVPILGINAGNLGFLTSVKAEEVFEELESVLAGRYNDDERIMLNASLVNSNKESEEVLGILNDVVISREGLTRFLNVSISVDGDLLTEFGGDGVIIATPTGSSAYSMSAGGPLVYPSIEAIIITPLCAHSLRSRPIIVSASNSISISVRCENEEDLASVIFDGQMKRKVHSHADITVRKSSETVRVIKCSHRSYFDVIHEKL